MRIGLNILYLVPGKVGGTETYAKGLIRGYLEVNRGNDYYVFCLPEAISILPKHPSLHIIAINGLATRVHRILYEQFILPFLINNLKIEVLHSFGYTTPLLTPCPRVTTVHDLNWYYHPEDFTYIERLSWRTLVRASIYASDIVVAVSNASKNSIIDVVGASPKKVKAILSGVPPIMNLDKNKEATIASDLKLPKKYILTISAGYPHKNLLTALAAYNKLQQKIPEVYFYICGLRGKADKDNADYIRKNKLEGKVKLLGYVDDEQIAVLYKRSSVFIFTSSYEGFGFPVLEALGYDIPVVSSNSFSLKELIKTKNALAEPYNVNGFATLLEKILRNKKFRIRTLETEKMILHQLSWRKTASSMLKYIHNLV